MILDARPHPRLKVEAPQAKSKKKEQRGRIDLSECNRYEIAVTCSQAHHLSTTHFLSEVDSGWDFVSGRSKLRSEEKQNICDIYFSIYSVYQYEFDFTMKSIYYRRLLLLLNETFSFFIIFFF